MLSFFRKKIGHITSQTWWHTTFSPEERKIIENAFKPLGSDTAKDVAESQNPIRLGHLAGHLKKEELRHLGYRVIAHADQLITDQIPVVDRHFFYADRGFFFYRWRNHDAFALDEAIESLKKQIALGPDVAQFFL